MSSPSSHTTPYLSVRPPGATPTKGRKDTPAMCGGCEARWYAASIAHCAGCHRTFGSVDLFDRHRLQRGEHGQCEDPGLIARTRQRTGGLTPRMVEIDGVWREPK